jgi:hypothetical protein
MIRPAAGMGDGNDLAAVIVNNLKSNDIESLLVTFAREAQEFQWMLMLRP